LPVVRSRRLIPAAGLIGLFTVSLVIRVYPAWVLHFDGLYGQDAYAYYDYGHQLREAITHLQLPGHFYWPLGYPALVALGFTFTGEQALGPQIVSLLVGAAVSVFAFLLTVEIAQEIGPDRRFARVAGLIAWAVLAFCGQLIQSSFVIMSDASALMWATFSAWALIRYSKTHQPSWIALCSFTLAWALITRWQYGGLALPWALYVLARRPICWRHTALAVIVGFVTLTPQIVHSAQNSALPINHMWIQGWSTGNILSRDFTTTDGTFHYDQSPAQYYAQPLTNVYYMSPLLLPLLVLGILHLLIKNRAALLLLSGWFAVEYGFLAGIPYENIRFALALIPPLAVCVGLGAALILTQRLPSYSIPNGLYRSALYLVRLIVILVIVHSLFATLCASVPMITQFIAAKDSDLASARWIEDHIPEPGATVYCLDLFLAMQHYTALHAVQLYDLTPDVISQQLPSARPAYAVFNVYTTEHQWYGQPLWVLYHWLKDNPGLEEIGANGNYTLYRIGQ
jgi:hypothetical protein